MDNEKHSPGEKKITQDELDKKLEEVFRKHGLILETTYKTGNFIRVVPRKQMDSQELPDKPDKSPKKPKE